ncbi:MAG: T9SS type A sorting domain-containing protein [Saprospiraceae bacterium]|nr:T9SS type A sorting domain-containing protein [Saprospiraceae bacterium]
MKIRQINPTLPEIDYWMVVICLMLAFAVNLAFGQESCSNDSTQMNWEAHDWPSGDTANIYRMPFSNTTDSVDVSIRFCTEAIGTFAAFDLQTPYIDGDTNAWNFGTGMDLGVIFDPDTNQGHSPVIITLAFDQPVTCVEFEISDIDVSGARKDSLVITGNDGLLTPTLYIMGDTPTVGVIGHKAFALGFPSGPSGNGSAYSNEEAGTILVDFANELIDSVTITYYEAGGEFDPGGRGLGLFGKLSFAQGALLPVDLLSFDVGHDEHCTPLIQWETSNEFGIDYYTIEYSYDGLNFVDAARVGPKNTYFENNKYNLHLARKLNPDNYFRLVKKEMDGSSQILALESLSGSQCHALSAVNIYPNPTFKNYFYVEIESKADKEIDILMIDQGGSRVMKQAYSLKTGRNWFAIQSKHLVPGIYHVRFNTGEEMLSRKISIME